MACENRSAEGLHSPLSLPDAGIPLGSVKALQLDYGVILSHFSTMSTVKATDLRLKCGPALDQAEEIVVKAGAVDRPAADQLAPVREDHAVRGVLRGEDQMVRALIIGAEAASQRETQRTQVWGSSSSRA